MSARVTEGRRIRPFRTMRSKQGGYLGVANRRSMGNGGSGGYLSQLLASMPWSVPLRNSLIPQRGTSTISYTRATTATVRNSDGRMVTALAGEARTEGSRRVQNLLFGGTENLSAAAWVKDGATIATGVTDPLGGSTAFTLTRTGAWGAYDSLHQVPAGLTPTGKTFLGHVWLRRNAGAGTVQIAVSDVSASTTYSAVTLTSSWQQFSYAVPAKTGTGYSFGIAIQTNGDAVDVWHPQLIDVTAEFDQTSAREYVSVGALIRNTQDPLFYSTPGTAGHYASSPDSVAASITGAVLDVDFVGALADWTPASPNVLVSKLGVAGQYGYDLYIAGVSTGTPFARFSKDGTAILTATATANVSFTDGSVGGLRVKRDPSTGNVTFYTSTDRGATWSQLGNVVATTAGNLFDGTDPLSIMASSGGASNNANGSCLRTRIYSGDRDSGGTLVVDFNPMRDAVTPTGTITSSTTGEVWTLNGASSVIRNSTYHGLGIDGVKAFSTYLSDQHFASLPGTAGSYIYTPDSAAITGITDFAAVFYGVVADYTPAVNVALIGKWDTATIDRTLLMYVDTSGKLGLVYRFADGTTDNPLSTVAIPFADGTVGRLAATLKINNGSGQREARFYTSTDGVVWTQLGIPVVPGTVASQPLTDSTVAYTVGGTANSNLPLNGKASSAQIYNGIPPMLGGAGSATPVVNFAATNYAAGTVSSTTGETWMSVGNVNFVNQVAGAALPTSAAFDAVRLNGVAGTYVSTPNAAANQITGDIDIRVKAMLADWTPAAYSILVAKATLGTNQRAYYFYVQTGSTGKLTLTTSVDGSAVLSTTTTNAPGFVDGSTQWLRVTRIAATGATSFYTSLDGGITWTLLETVANTAGAIYASSAAVELGSYDSGALPLSGKIYQAQIYNGINGTLAVDFNASRYVGGSTLQGGTGETWTLNGTSHIDPINCPNYGYLSEAAGQNSILQSNAYTTTWTAVGTPTASQNLIGPNGQANYGWTLGDDAAGTLEYYYQSVASAANTSTYSIKVKKTFGAQTAYPVLVLEETAAVKNSLCTVDTSNGVVTPWTAYTGYTINTTVARIKPTPDGLWWLVELVSTKASAGAWVAYIIPAGTTNPVQSTGVFDVAAIGSHGFCDSQLELGVSSATSYIATTTTALARNADVLSYIGGDAPNIKAVSARASRRAGVTNIGGVVALTDGTLNNYAAINPTSATSMSFTGLYGGSVQWNQAASNAIVPDAQSRAAFSAATNDIKMGLNTVGQAPDIVATVPTTNRVDVGHIAGSYGFNGTVCDLYADTKPHSQNDVNWLSAA